ncbi:MAG TPA: penicillin acylase family protein [Solimonas sp.]|nr:penicillin acylase family protein [Solimonas sp.]
MRRWIVGVLVGLAVVLLVAAGAGWRMLAGSLPRLDGRATLAGLAQPVTIERDALGVPTVTAANRLDLARATGYVHAQDRYTQMDFMRRSAAGELAELAGASMVDADRAVRMHRMRALAHSMLPRATPEDRALIQAYTDGVNAGLAALGARPFEYWFMHTRPQPWLPEDTLLIVYAMWFQLTDENAERDAMLEVMHAVLPPAVYAFVTQSGTRWDAPLRGARLPEVPLPGPQIYDLRTQAAAPPSARSAEPFDAAFGSNNWAVDAAHSADGAAWIADDMHMSLMVPNNWYRMRLVIAGGGDTQPLDETGVMLPGTPVLSVGSNRHVAWGFTNVFGDFSDRVNLEPDPQDPSRYLTPDGSQPFVIEHETIRVNGSADVPLEVKTTIWGPVIGTSADGREQAVWWLAAQPEVANLRLGWIEQSRNVEEALAVANGVGIPPQNFVVADSSGRIGWTVGGMLPRRPPGFDPSLPASWAQAPGVSGYLKAEEFPRVVAPEAGRLWTANQRTLDGAELARLGDGGYDIGARAGQIRDALLAVDRATPADLLRIQLDDRAGFLASWQPYLQRALDGLAAREPAYAAAAQAVRDWGGHAAAGSVGYRLVREFHDELRDRMFDALCAPCRARAPKFKRMYLKQWDEAALRILEADAVHLIPPQQRSVQELIESVAQEVVDRAAPLAGHSWGARNTLHIQHPLGRAVPWLARYIDMPSQALPGDADLPRVQGPAFGASERFAVSPGHEERGYFHMPGGQSGHPLSPYYRAGHQAWVEGRPTPFLPGAPEHTLTLAPR